LKGYSTFQETLMIVIACSTLVLLVLAIMYAGDIFIPLIDFWVCK